MFEKPASFLRAPLRKNYLTTEVTGFRYEAAFAFRSLRSGLTERGRPRPLAALGD